MSDKNSPASEEDAAAPVEVYSYFVRHRNALAVRANFERLYVDYYLHLLDHGLRNAPVPDQMLKDALAAVVLHATTRPWKETHAWTLNLQEPPINLFVTASSLQESVTGRVFTEGVREGGTSTFHAQVSMSMAREEPRRSMTEFKGDDIFAAVEHFYHQSEQRPCRVLRPSEEEFVMISAQPDCDVEWLMGLTVEDVRRLEEDEELSLLEKRQFQFNCGCTLDRVYPALAPLARRGLDELFQGDEAITVSCPRCAARWRVSREQLEAVMNP